MQLGVVSLSVFLSLEEISGHGIRAELQGRDRASPFPRANTPKVPPQGEKRLGDPHRQDELFSTVI